MSQTQLQRIKVTENAIHERLTTAQAAELLQVSARTVQRLIPPVKILARMR